RYNKTGLGKVICQNLCVLKLLYIVLNSFQRSWREGITCERSDCLLKHNVLSRGVLLACVFFDRQLTGSVRRADLHNILLSLGLWLTPTQVQELLNKVSVEGQCPYKIASRWEEPQPNISMEGYAFSYLKLDYNSKKFLWPSLLCLYVSGDCIKDRM
uniref:EF-hand domain-containing protein n=1 Tax=Hucho hucho TaxID=62062 RepID=A0A4W5MI04_9TELE